VFFYGHTMVVNELQCCLASKVLQLSSVFTEEINAYSFGTIWGWENDDWIFIFEWTIHL